jgi:hypothetical protein
MYCHHCGPTCTRGYYLCTCRFGFIITSHVSPRDLDWSQVINPQPTGDVIDPCSSPFMLDRNSILQQLQPLQLLPAFHTAWACHNTPGLFLCHYQIEWIKGKFPDIRRLLGTIPWCGPSCKHHCFGTRVDHYFGMLGLSTPPPPSKACGRSILGTPWNPLSLPPCAGSIGDLCPPVR